MPSIPGILMSVRIRGGGAQAFEKAQGLLAVFGLLDIMTKVGQRQAQDIADVLFVIDQ
jgi:hypothetical protein